ncbi:polysaccharide deacetylase family protein [Rhizobium rhizogenes]|uniref:polysaccharide deacetylase family protein n=1 Tax=Rhizobium rhizogenes TaxID=359 RepID=UPI0008100FD6|nr:polysaccharide deacetylase [Rhizobium rhizogenes]NTI45039.1 polysaccharide deacetylase [Rhizobium rhizogenes]OCJ10712.1 polysaccharide deacetylase [Agrobacterium sp. B131/95]
MAQDTVEPPSSFSPFPAYEWPEGKKSAVLLSVDVDATSPFLWEQREGLSNRLSRLEVRRFGLRTGMTRILDLFARYDVKASFYVPAVVAKSNPGLLPALVDAGHEIGLHGYFHELVGDIGNEEFSAALDASLALFIAQTGQRPVGFRSPAWEMTPHMLAEIRRNGLAYDSSLMGFDHPYEIDGVVEIPVQWAIDDAIFFKFENSGNERWAPSAGAQVLDDWLTEWRAQHRFGGLFTLTIHDWISGRAQRIVMLEKLLDAITAEPTSWVATAADIARHHASSNNRGRFVVEADIPAAIGPSRFGPSQSGAHA